MPQGDKPYPSPGTFGSDNDPWTYRVNDDGSVDILHHTDYSNPIATLPAGSPQNQDLVTKLGTGGYERISLTNHPPSTPEDQEWVETTTREIKRGYDKQEAAKKEPPDTSSWTTRDTGDTGDTGGWDDTGPLAEMGSKAFNFAKSVRDRAVDKALGKKKDIVVPGTPPKEDTDSGAPYGGE